MLAERGVNVDHSNDLPLVQRYAPKEMGKTAALVPGVTLPILPVAHETYVKVNGRCGVSVPDRRQPGPHCRDFYLSCRNSKAAYRFLQNPQQREEVADPNDSSNTDKAPAHGRALALLKREGRYARLTLNNDRLAYRETT